MMDTWAVAVFVIAVSLAGVIGFLKGSLWLLGWPEFLLIWLFLAGWYGGQIPILFRFPLLIVPQTVLLYLPFLIVPQAVVAVVRPRLNQVQWLEHPLVHAVAWIYLIGYLLWLIIFRGRALLTAIHKGMRFGFGLGLSAGVYRVGCEIILSQTGTWDGGVPGAVSGTVIGVFAGVAGAGMTGLLRTVREDGT
jgi:hypothetical protein